MAPDVILIHGAEYGPGSEHALILGGANPAKLPGTDIALSIRLYVRISEHADGRSSWKAIAISYFHTVFDGSDREIIAYHWHPDWRSPITTPRLHLGAGANVGREELRKAHVPTGFIELEDVLLLAIREFGARPRRDDWAMILDRA
ncbi:MAG: hypothetical protein ACRDSJ_08585 [Rubrobacteraceae bacterium]